MKTITGTRIPDRRAGFVNPTWMILVALAGLILAVVLPQFLRHGWRRGLLALLGLCLMITAGVGVLMGFLWLMENLGREGEGWRDKALRGLGHLLRFLFFGFIAAILGVALVGGFHLGVGVENAVSALCGLLGGGLGCWLHQRLGAFRFWVAFRRFCLALLGSLMGGILGILGPEPWGISFGILVPLLVFVVLAAMGRIVPPRDGVSPSVEEGVGPR
ncbi:MAG: hypothetical protein Q8O00_05975 [Holophaga sp.]|nr:hypothetical protein [Holophaga sp.]